MIKIQRSYVCIIKYLSLIKFTKDSRCNYLGLDRRLKILAIKKNLEEEQINKRMPLPPYRLLFFFPLMKILSKK